MHNKTKQCKNPLRLRYRNVILLLFRENSHTSAHAGGQMQAVADFHTHVQIAVAGKKKATFVPRKEKKADDQLKV